MKKLLLSALIGVGGYGISPAAVAQQWQPCASNGGAGYGSHWYDADGTKLAKDSPDLNDGSICAVSGTGAPSSVQPVYFPPCGSNNGQGFGDHWIEAGQEFAKDSPDLNDGSICAVQGGVHP